MGYDNGSKLALVVRQIPMYGGGRAEVFYVGASCEESPIIELSASGYLDLARKIKAKIIDAANAGVGDTIFDMVNIRFISSTGLGTLVNLYHEIHSKGGRAVLINLNTKIADVLEVTQLNGVFFLAGSMEEAVQHLLSVDGKSST